MFHPTNIKLISDSHKQNICVIIHFSLYVSYVRVQFMLIHTQKIEEDMQFVFVVFIYLPNSKQITLGIRFKNHT